MALDGIYLNTLVNNLKETFINCKIDKISQPEKDEIILTIRKDRKNLKMLISASSNFPRIQITNIQKENPLKAPMFLMVLRKYLINGRIIDITQVKGDRVVIFKIESSDEMGFNSSYNLVVEIMGRHSNITLVRERDNKIMECIKHITPDINSFRTLLPGLCYVNPPISEKLDPHNFTLEEFNNFIRENSIEFNEGFFSTIFNGISKVLSVDLYSKYINSGSNLTYYLYFKEFIKLLSNENKYYIYRDFNGTYKDFYCFSLDNFKNKFEEISYTSPWEQMDVFFSEKDKTDRLHNRSTSLQRLVNTNIDRCKKKGKILEKTLIDCSNKDNLRILGDLLTSYIYSFKKGDESVTILNYFNEDEEYIDITLDPNKTPSENVQSYYKKYNKQKKAEEGALEQLEKNQIEITYLTSVLTNLINVDNYQEIEEIKKELIETGYIKFRKNAKGMGKMKSSKPLHFKSSEGIDIYVGKNNIQNDELTFKFASRGHLWFHAKNMPGSHVILCTNELLDKSIEEAGQIAAYYSKGKGSSKVDVDYTYVKNLKKPTSGKPGMVIYHTNWTLTSDAITLPDGIS
ncbi:MAG: Rqc2 family fibronectin-binding protein [Clostridium sp.]